MSTAEQDLKDLVLDSGPFGPAQIQQIRQTIAADVLSLRRLREAVQELERNEDRSPAANVRLGVCYYLVGRFDDAIRTLGAADGGPLARFYQARAYFQQSDYAAAADAYDAAAKGGYGDAALVAKAEAQRYMLKYEEAMATLDGLSGPIEQTADYLFQRGASIAAGADNPQEAIALFERAVERDGKHAGALFALAVENDRRGNDETALGLYERSVSQFPAHVGALLNLGLLYEDRGRNDRAAGCYRRILDVFPNDPRARMYLKDVEGDGASLFDEDALRERELLAHKLNIPVTDFELSVRSRNCLQKMGIQTLGDLTRYSEPDLLASKNFGETSLTEIREMLESKGLELGQFATERRIPEPVYEPVNLSPDEKALLERPISDLNLSVRARKCMARLNLGSIGELARKTADDLLECKNFGVTSLNEIREKLGSHGLKLRGE